MSPLDKVEEIIKTAQAGEVYRSVLNEIERCLIEKTLEQTSGNQLIAARILGLNRNTLRSKIKKLNISLQPFRSRPAVKKV